jgi:hypothetical protein
LPCCQGYKKPFPLPLTIGLMPECLCMESLLEGSVQLTF